MIGEDLDRAINKTLQDARQSDTESGREQWEQLTAGLDAFPIPSTRSGYIQTIDYAGLAALAKAHDCYIEIETRAGKFIVERARLGQYYATHVLDDAVIDSLRTLVVSGRERTPIQDIEFAIDQLVQVALRALSPGINDPYTAMNCIDWLSAACARIATRSFPPSHVTDADEVLRIAADSFTFPGAVDAMFNPLRQNARGNEMVVIHLLEAIAAITSVTANDAWRGYLLQQAEMIYESAQDNIAQRADRDVIEQRCAAVKASGSDITGTDLQQR
jgi:uncharacterized membrane protein